VNLPVSGLSSSPAVLSLCSLVLVRSTLLVQLKVLLLGFDLILWGFPCVAPDGLKGVRFILVPSGLPVLGFWFRRDLSLLSRINMSRAQFALSVALTL
jgi:hypothetical protein